MSFAATMSKKARYVVFILTAAAALIAATLIVRSLGEKSATPLPSTTPPRASPVLRSARPPAVDPCAHHRPMNKKLGWVCRDDRAPVDLVTEKSMLMSVLHVPTPVLVLETQRLDPKIAVVDPKRPPQAVCVLKGAAAGLSGYVSWAALHDAPCPR